MSVGKELLSDQFNATSSSAATYLDEGRSYASGQTYGNQYNNLSNKAGSGLSGFTANIMFSKTPVLSDKLPPEPSSSHRQTSQSYSIQPQQNASYAQQLDSRIGYTPQQHTNKPRSIQSNELRQRTLDAATASGTSASQYAMNQSDLHSDLGGPAGALSKNMSHSSGASGFGHERNSGPADKLRLLKSN